MAVELSRQGCEVVVTGRRPDALEALGSRIGARTVVADLAEPSGLHLLLEQSGELDILVANAAIPASGDLEEWDQDGIERALRVNLAAPVTITRAMLPSVRARGWGHFVYVSSLSGKVGSRGTALYSATKFGVRGFAAALRCDLRGSGVGCSVVSPGFVRDAGLFADTGVSLPPGFPSATSRQVALAVVKAIRTDRAEVTVAALPLRIGAALGGVFPGISASVQALAGGDLADRIVSAQRGKR